MNNKNEINIALDAAAKPIMVESAQQLEQVLASLLECETIGIDTEFVRERTWRADLGLVQLSDGKTVWLVDPLKIGTIEPLSILLNRQDIVKILHAPPEDLDVLLYGTGAVPDPLFDTQIACAMLGQPLQMGYHTTVEWLLDIVIDKGETRSNWCHRPLREAQIKYAALDVCLLPMMYRQLTQKLQELNRESWLAEDCARLLNKARTPADPEQCWRRINGHNRLDGASLAILQALATWRDNEAEKRNLARGFVIKDNDLMTIANKMPRNSADLSKLDKLHPRAIQRHGTTLIAIMDQVIQKGLIARIPESIGPEHRKLMGKMRQVVKDKASELSVDPALLASRRELESLILSAEGEPLPERFLGWRKSIITDELIALKNDHPPAN